MSEETYTTPEVSALTGITEDCIANWVRRGYLTPAEREGKFNKYRLGDVFTCEKSRKRQHRRRE